MATSRTGTGRWKRLRAEALSLAQSHGLTTCPCAATCRHHRGRVCAVTLNYDVGLTPASAEADHITPHARGGRDELANLRVVCRRCNQARGSKPTHAAHVRPRTTTTLVPW